MKVMVFMRYRFHDRRYIPIVARSDILGQAPEIRGHFVAAESNISRAQAERSISLAAASINFFSAGVKSTLINSVLRSDFGFGGLPIFMDLLLTE
jgi:hypothetical protein